MTDYDFKTGKLNIVEEIKYGTDPERAKVKCYGADSVQEGVAIMEHEDVDISITGNSTNPTRFQHPVAGCYKKARSLRAAARAVRSIRITWQPARLPMV